MLDPWSNHRTLHLKWTLDGWCDPGYIANLRVALFAVKMLLKQLLLGSFWFVKHLGETDLSRTILMKPWQLDCPAHKFCTLLTFVMAWKIHVQVEIIVHLLLKFLLQTFGLKLNKTKSFRNLLWEILEDWMEFSFSFSRNFHGQTSPTSLMPSKVFSNSLSSYCNCLDSGILSLTVKLVH